MGASKVMQLPLRERLQIMEASWEDLRTRADSFDIPLEQKELLDSRPSRVASGEVTARNWDDVKGSIEGAISPFMSRLASDLRGKQ